MHNHLKVELVRGQAGMARVSTPASLRKKEEAVSLIITSDAAALTTVMLDW